MLVGVPKEIKAKEYRSLASSKLFAIIVFDCMNYSLI